MIQKTTASILFFLIISNSCLSQSSAGGKMEGGNISGQILDAKSNIPIEYANIVLFSSKDSSQINGTVTDTKGNFNILKIRPGSYYAEVMFIGYERKRIDNISIKPPNMNKNLGEIKITPEAINLQNIVVQGERTPVSYQIDKKVIDVDQIQTVVSGNAADVLENVPSVTVDIEGNVSLRGSTNFTVLVDGRPSVIDAQDVLQQVPASSIKTIEIVTNPSAKYDPEGTAGIINIKLKKDQNLGLSGIVNANAGWNNKYGGDFLFEYKNNGVSYNFGLDYNRRFHPGTRLEEKQFFLNDITTNINSTGRNEWKRNSMGLRGGLEFVLSENNFLSFGGRYGSREMGGNSILNYTEWSSMDPIQQIYQSNSERERSGYFYSMNMNYLHKFSQNGHELSGEFFYSYNNTDEITVSSEIENQIQFDGKKTTEIGPSKDLRGKIDYILPFNENSKFEAGMQGEMDLSNEENGLYQYNPQNQLYELQPLYSNLTDYNRNELAIYSLYADELNNLGFQGGIRTEYTFREIILEKTNQNFKIDRWDIFPTLHSSYKFNGGTQLMASYTRRIERPRGWELEPFDTWMNATNVRRGNPALNPEFIDSYELGFQTLFGEVSLSNEFYYRLTKNKKERIQSAYGDNITLHLVENIGKDYALGAEFMIVFDPFEFWNSNLMGNLYNYKVEGVLNNQDFSRESFNWNSRLNNVFKLSQSTQFQLNFSYNSPTVSSQGRREGFFTTDIAAKQDFLERKLSLTLQVRDLFSTAKYEFTSQGIDFYNYSHFTRESPMVMLNLRFNFNPKRNEEKSQRDRSQEEGFDGGDEF